MSHAGHEPAPDALIAGQKRIASMSPVVVIAQQRHLGRVGSPDFKFCASDAADLIQMRTKVVVHVSTSEFQIFGSLSTNQLAVVGFARIPSFTISKGLLAKSTTCLRIGIYL